MTPEQYTLFEAARAKRRLRLQEFLARNPGSAQGGGWVYRRTPAGYTQILSTVETLIRRTAGPQVPIPYPTEQYEERALAC